MNKNSYHYKVYHKENKNITEEISNINGVKNIVLFTSVRQDNERWNENVICTRIKINTMKKLKFEELDEKLKNMYIDIWFEF